MNKESFFRDKVVIITGASSGIGEATAIALARLKARIVLTARNEQKLKELESRIASEGHQAFAVKTDVSRRDDLGRLISLSIRRWGRIDILISNAGQYIRGNVIDADVKKFEESFAINFYGHLYAIQEVLPVMLRQGSGWIVLMNTLDSKKGIVGDAPYVAAKTALHGLGDVVRQELSDKGIRVISVYPGRIDTPMIEHLTVPRISAKIPPSAVVDAMIRGIIKNKPRIIVPGRYFLFGSMNDLFPAFMDKVYKRFGVEGKEL